MHTLTVNSIVASDSCAEAAVQILLHFIWAFVTGLLSPDVCCKVTLRARKHLQDVALWGVVTRGTSVSGREREGGHTS